MFKNIEPPTRTCNHSRTKPLRLGRVVYPRCDVSWNWTFEFSHRLGSEPEEAVAIIKEKSQGVSL
jgi:hypothetical protein